MTAKVAKVSGRGSKPGERRGGRKAGTANKMTAAIKDMILAALDGAHPEGGIGYLKQQSAANPVAFMGLVGKVLPLQVTGPGEGGEHIHKVVREIVRPSHPDS